MEANTAGLTSLALNVESWISSLLVKQSNLVKWVRSFSKLGRILNWHSTRIKPTFVFYVYRFYMGFKRCVCFLTIESSRYNNRRCDVVSAPKRKPCITFLIIETIRLSGAIVIDSLSWELWFFHNSAIFRKWTNLDQLFALVVRWIDDRSRAEMSAIN